MIGSCFASYGPHKCTVTPRVSPPKVDRPLPLPAPAFLPLGENQAFASGQKSGLSECSFGPIFAARLQGCFHLPPSLTLPPTTFAKLKSLELIFSLARPAASTLIANRTRSSSFRNWMIPPASRNPAVSATVRTLDPRRLDRIMGTLFVSDALIKRI